VDLLPAATRRLMSDLKHLQQEPIPLANASPCSDSDISLWNGVIGCEMEITHIGLVTVPLHFLIDFPRDYPSSAPNIGFSFEFEYRSGASYTQQSGRLSGKKVICLDVLGNFGNVHTEWKKSVGSGWSPAYNVSTLLIQLQSVLCNLGSEQNQRQRDITYQSAVRFSERHPSAMLEILDDEDIREAKRRRQEEQRSEASSGPEVNPNIRCWMTGRPYTEALLGVGVRREKRNLATAAELLCKEAYDGGLRQNTDKSAFEFFLPVWINEAHAAGRWEWRHAILRSCRRIGKDVYEVDDEDTAILEVFPRLVNQMVVEMMSPKASKSEAIALFEALCNFWRTFRWLVETRPALRGRIVEALSGFVTDEAFRHKDRCADLGALIVQYTVLQGDAQCPSRRRFIDAYSDENSLRQVMWWQRSGTKPEPWAVFEATRVSREILMFQMMVVDVVIGDAAEAVRDMEASNCTLPAKLEELQARWRERKQAIGSWAAYFECIGAAGPKDQNLEDWIATCVRRASDRGPKYGGAKGAGKGSKGKGGSEKGAKGAKGDGSKGSGEQGKGAKGKGAKGAKGKGGAKA